MRNVVVFLTALTFLVAVLRKTVSIGINFINGQKMKEDVKQFISSTFCIAFGVTILMVCLTINSFRSYTGGIASNSFFQVSGLFSQMFPLMYGVACILIGYGLRGIKAISFSYCWRIR